MNELAVIFWSGTGNTASMAAAVVEGAGSQAKLVNVNDITADQAAQYDRLALGCPSMGDEVLEEDVFEPFFTALEGQLSGKKVVLFGSYDWGDGQWMRDWAERTKKAGAQLVGIGVAVEKGFQGGGDKFRAMKDVPYKALAVIESASAEDGITFREDD